MLSKNRNNLIYDDDKNRDSEDDQDAGQMDGQMGEMNGQSLVNKRAINYQIEKNKGLTPKRDRMYRNPRVRNRFKARRAQIKHKSIVPKVRTQEKRYSGESTGIRTGVLRGVKIK